MGHIFDFKDAGNYDAWFNQDKNRYCLDLEIKLLLDLLSPKMVSGFLILAVARESALNPC